MAIKIREAYKDEMPVIAHAVQLYRIQLSDYRKKPGKPLPVQRDLEKYWTEQNKRVYIMLEDKKLVGFCLLDELENACIIRELGIITQYQRKGYGTRLVNHIIDYCKSKEEIKEVRAYVRIFNDPAREFFKSLKFEENGEKRKDGDKAILYVYKIEE